MQPVRVGPLRFAWDRPALMGVLNVTPDSFSDGGALPSPAAVVARAAAHVAAGATLLDLGGESTRPGAAPVAEAEELRRVLPALAALRAAALPAALSIDTRRARVAAAALAAGAHVVNDVGGLRDPAMVAAVAAHGAVAICMHMRGTPRDMAAHAHYGDVVAEVRAALAAAAERARRGGVAAGRVWIDPGLGFAKDAAQSLALLAGVPALASLGMPVVIGASRKRFLGAATGRAIGDRDRATAAACALAVAGGAQVLRVHDVAAARDAVWVAAATRDAGRGGARACTARA